MNVCMYLSICICRCVCVCMEDYINANFCLSSFGKLLESDTVSCTIFVPLEL